MTMKNRHQVNLTQEIWEALGEGAKGERVRAILRDALGIGPDNRISVTGYKGENKIGAIILLRNVSYLGLKEAKDAVEGSNPEPFEYRKEQSPGPLARDSGPTSAYTLDDTLARLRSVGIECRG